MRYIMPILLRLSFMTLSFFLVLTVEHYWRQPPGWGNRESIIEALVITLFAFLGCEVTDRIRRRKREKQ
jgi:hypothetical protein